MNHPTNKIYEELLWLYVSWFTVWQLDAQVNKKKIQEAVNNIIKIYEENNN